MKLKLFIILWLVLLLSPAKAWVSVGSSPGYGTCTYSTIQQAIDSNQAEIRILNNQDFFENLVINHSVNIRGGFNSCLAASLNLGGNSNSVIKGSANLGAPVVEINSINSPTIRFYDLTLRDATDTVIIANGGHAIDIGSSNGLIEVIDSLIISNNGENGGGIYIGAAIGIAPLNLIITDSSVFGNTASIRGGGLYCSRSNAVVRISGNSLISENSAEDGGGIAASNGCHVTVDSGSDLTGDLRGIVANTATQFGGGVFLNSEASLTLQGNRYAFGILGNSTDPVTVSGNSAYSKGGGIYAINGAEIEITDGYIANNLSSSHGGGIYLGESSTAPVALTMQSSSLPCWNPGKCSILSSNKSDANGGGLYLQGAAQATILNTHVFGNRANYGTAVYVSAINGLGTTASIEGSYFYKNGNNGANSYADNFVIRGNGDVDVNLLHNTMADNDINDTRSVIGIANSSLTLKNSIVDNYPESVFTETGTNITNFSCVVASDLTIPGAYLFPPYFVDRINDDYHLASNSGAIDTCASVTTLLNDDADNENRGWDDYTVVDFNGFYDAGADESYISDIIFKHGFE